MNTNALITCLFIVGCGLMMFLYYDSVNDGYMQMIGSLVILGGIVGLFVSQPVKDGKK